MSICIYVDKITYMHILCSIHILCKLPDRVQYILIHQQGVDGRHFPPPVGPSQMMLALALSWTLIVLPSKHYRLISWKNTFKWAWSLRHVQSYSLAFNSNWHHNHFAAKVEMQSCYLLADSLHPQRWLFHRSHLDAFLCLLAPLFYLLLTLALITSNLHMIQIHLVF